MAENVFQRGETVPIWVEVRNWAGTLTDPDQGVTLVHLTDPAGTPKKEDEAMSGGVGAGLTGKFVYYYASASEDVTGWWRYQTKSQDGTGTGARYTVSESGFELK